MLVHAHCVDITVAALRQTCPVPRSLQDALECERVVEEHCPQCLGVVASETNVSCIEECLANMRATPGSRPAHRCSISPNAVDAFHCAQAFALTCANCSTSVQSSTNAYVQQFCGGRTVRHCSSMQHAAWALTSTSTCCRGHGLIAFMSTYEVGCLQACYEEHTEVIVTKGGCEIPPASFVTMDVAMMVAGAFGIDASSMSVSLYAPRGQFLCFQNEETESVLKGNRIVLQEAKADSLPLVS
jgi:hypothetical protein